MPATGQHFNLKQDWWRDERRDPIASTNAALDYLEKLFEMQGDWYLALASYNWGEGSVQRAMAKNEAAGQPTDYLSLSMPDETRNYVPKLQAIKNIIADPQRYAVALPPVGNTPYFVTVRKNSDIDLEIAAKLAEMPLDEFKALNPSFNRPVIRGDHAPTLLLPADRVEIFNANLTNYKGDLSAWKVYHSRRGDPTRPSPSASASARPSCAKPMTSARARRSRPAQSMLVPGDPAPAASSGLAGPAVGALDSAPASSSKAAPHGRATPTPPARVSSARPNVRTHKIRQGDTLFSLAKQYGTTVDALRALSNLKGNALKVGGNCACRAPTPGVEVPERAARFPRAPQRTGKTGSARP